MKVINSSNEGEESVTKLLEDEIECLWQADPETSLTLYEYFKYEKFEILVTEYLPGYDLNHFCHSIRSDFNEE